MRRFLARQLVLPLLAAALLQENLQGEPVAVRHPQGSAYGFVALKTLEGNHLAIGDMTQVFTAIASLLASSFISATAQFMTTPRSFPNVAPSGSSATTTSNAAPSFPKPIDILIDALTGQIDGAH